MTARGRPPGRTRQGEATRELLFDTAVAMFGEHGFTSTTLRGIATQAGVSPGLVYKYFDSKEAIVLTLYARLSADYADTPLPAGAWTVRSIAAIRGSLATLAPHRTVLVGVLPALLADRQAGLLSIAAADSRRRVRQVFLAAADDATQSAPDNAVLGRLAYLLQLGVLLWWVLDRSPDQRATDGLLALLDRAAPLLGPALWVPGVMPALRVLDALASDALYEDPPED